MALKSLRLSTIVRRAIRLFEHKAKNKIRHPRRVPSIESLEWRCNPSTVFLATDLISDQPGIAPTTDPTLTNAWGISLSPNGGGFWVSSNGGGLSEVYGGDVNGSPITQ